MITTKLEYYNGHKPVVIDLTGPDGNAFVLMATAKGYAKQLNYSDEKIDDLLRDMKSDDYEYLLNVFDSHFGSFCTLLK